MIENCTEVYHYRDIGVIVYNLMMIVLIVFMMIQCYKMEKLHKERMALVKELDELLSSVKCQREIAASLIQDMKKKVDDLKDEDKS